MNPEQKCVRELALNLEPDFAGEELAEAAT
jgi:hypothetical protein